jgi:microsomal epoxide hydrolase
MRNYADAVKSLWNPSHSRTPVVEAPVAITFLGGENPPGVTTEKRIDVFKNGPRAQFFNVQFTSAHEAGGHFGYYENPAAVISDLRDFFRRYRTPNLAL